MTMFTCTKTCNPATVEDAALRQLLGVIDEELQDAPRFAIDLSAVLRDELRQRARPPEQRQTAIAFNLPTEALTPEGVWAVQSFLVSIGKQLTEWNLPGGAAFVASLHQWMAEGLAAGIAALERAQADLN